MAESNLKEQLKKRYGAKKGLQIYLAIVPGILADFKKMLAKAAPGEQIEETYRFEDDNGAVKVSGCKDDSGNIQMEASLFFTESD